MLMSAHWGSRPGLGLGGGDENTPLTGGDENTPLTISVDTKMGSNAD